MASLEDQLKLSKLILKIEEKINSKVGITAETRGRYNNLLKESARLQKASIESNKIDQGIQKDISKIQKDIVKSNQSKVGMLLKGNIQGLLEQKNMSKTLGLQLKIKQSQDRQSKTLSKLVGKGKITIEDRNKLLKINKGISDGTTNEADLASELNGLSKKGLKLRGLFELQGKKNIDLRDDENKASERANELQEKMNAAFVKGAAIFGVLASIATKFGASIDKIGQTFGSLSVMGKPFQEDLLRSSVEATKLGGGMEDVAAITSTLASNFGMNVDEAAKLSTKVFDTSKAIGLSADESANLFGTLTQTANLSAEQAESLAEGAFQLARQNGVAPSAVMKDIAGSTEEIASFTQDGGDNIAEAAVQARKMGLSLSTTAKIAEGLLDFESSISKEVEASVLIGKQLNFQKAREAALSGDIAKATQEVVKQVGSEADFNKLNVIQRKALADSIGVSVTEMSKLVGQSDKLSLSGALASGNFSDLLGEEGISNISKLTGQFAALGATLTNSFGPVLSIIVSGMTSMLTPFVAVIQTLEKMNALVPAVAAGVTGLATAYGLAKMNIMLATAAKKKNVAVSSISIVKTVGEAIAQYFKNAGLMGGATFGFGTIAGLAVAAAGTAAVLAGVAKAKSVNDFKSGPGGITHMSGPAGAFSLNPRDSVLATTNPIPVNDMMTGPAGSINPGGGQNMNITVRSEGIQNRTIQQLVDVEFGGSPGSGMA